MLLQVSSRRRGDMQFQGASLDPTSTCTHFNVQSSTTTPPTAEFKLVGTRLPSGNFDIEFLEPGDKLDFSARQKDEDEFHHYFSGEIVNFEREHVGGNATILVRGRHHFGRWVDLVASIREQSGTRGLRDLLEHLAEDARLNLALLTVSDAANVSLGRFRAQRMPAFALVNYLLVYYKLYGTFEREGTFSVRTLVEEDQLFRSTAPASLGAPLSVTHIKGPSIGVLAQPLAVLNLSTRLQNALLAQNINTVGDVVGKSAHEVLLAKNVGSKTIEELRKALFRYGLALRGERPSPGHKE